MWNKIPAETEIIVILHGYNSGPTNQVITKFLLRFTSKVAAWISHIMDININIVNKFSSL